MWRLSCVIQVLIEYSCPVLMRTKHNQYGTIRTSSGAQSTVVFPAKAGYSILIDDNGWVAGSRQINASNHGMTVINTIVGILTHQRMFNGIAQCTVDTRHFMCNIVKSGFQQFGQWPDKGHTHGIA